MDLYDQYELQSYIREFLDRQFMHYQDHLNPMECKLVNNKFISRYPDYRSVDYRNRTLVSHDFDYKDLNLSDFRPYGKTFTPDMIEEMFRRLESEYIMSHPPRGSGDRGGKKKGKKKISGWGWLGNGRSEDWMA